MRYVVDTEQKRLVPWAPAPVEFGARGAAGIPRDVDLEKMKRLIEGGALSDREAEYYREVAKDGVIVEKEAPREMGDKNDP